MKPSWIAGVDGFRRGWFVRPGEPCVRPANQKRCEVCGSFKAVLHLAPAPKVIAIDIPIGLSDKPEMGGRIKTNMKIVGFA